MNARERKQIDRLRATIKLQAKKLVAAADWQAKAIVKCNTATKLAEDSLAKLYATQRAYAEAIEDRDDARAVVAEIAVALACLKHPTIDTQNERIDRAALAVTRSRLMNPQPIRRRP